MSRRCWQVKSVGLGSCIFYCVVTVPFLSLARCLVCLQPEELCGLVACHLAIELAVNHQRNFY